MTDTLLAISGVGLAPWSSRGCTQKLEPLDQSKQSKRTINGALHDLSLPQFRKYKSSVSCNDINSPSFDLNWPGKTLTVDCISELSYPTGTGGAPGRTIVPGSSRTDSGTTFYRPRLTMIMTSWDTTYNEYGDETGWSIELEEV
jgi:hypothetical protein